MLLLTEITEKKPKKACKTFNEWLRDNYTVYTY